MFSPTKKLNQFKACESNGLSKFDAKVSPLLRLGIVIQPLFILNEFVVLQVRVVEVPGVSMELCGGTHVSNTSEIRGFRIISEQGIASGIRRIEAVAGEAFIEYVTARDSYIKQLCSTLKVCFVIFDSQFFVLVIYNRSLSESGMRDHSYSSAWTPYTCLRPPEHFG